ncbi:MAG: DNA mismatch repair protein MutS [Ruminococcaceae bacterium]|nr:DNA mismatch repair protein MutS [Oscillospiraceae bacterium]
MAEFTPMMQQYFKIKESYRDAILFYRLGDFYEMFFDDAKTASRELELVLTGRECGQEERAPMCGVPFHAAENYIARLVAKGYKVAVCEQTEDPALAKGIVTRDVIRVVTPGTVTESIMLDEAKNNYLACVYLKEGNAGLCFADVSTGEVFVSEVSGAFYRDGIINELARFAPTELITNGETSSDKSVRAFISRKTEMLVNVLSDEKFSFSENAEIIKKHFGKDVNEMLLGDMPYAVSALGSTLSYLYSTAKNSLANITSVEIYNNEKYLSLSAVSRRNLELTESERRREKKGSLLWVLDKTKTAPGKRMLRNWVEQPLVNLTGINNRLNAVSELFDDTQKRSELMDVLTGINDLERITTRVVYGSANAKELRSLCQTANALPVIKELLSDVKCNMLRDICRDIDTLDDLRELIDRGITEDPPFSVREGNMIKDGYFPELDELRDIVNGGKDYLTKLAADEQEKTGIKKLKIGYNRVFGYYIEVLNSFKEYVPEHYIRKQTLSNCERYITPELKELESKVLGAQERITKLEYELFCEIRNTVAQAQFRLKTTACAVAKLDALCSLAHVAVNNGYVRPEINLSDVIDIKDGRHPVVEKFLDGAPFVPNDTYLDNDENIASVITGPNMAGKSTYMRQTAIIVLMAQMGSFVPAKKATIGIVDSIFTRVGASDDLIGGQSTFMTEMSEVSSILSNATSKSLIILDEIGRGTSTYDGMSIARAVLEYVSDKKKIGAKTLFATHYHELTELEQTLHGVKNYNTSVKKRGDDITFLRRIVRGPADGSYGIEVAKLSGVPASVVSRAKVILRELEENGNVAAPVVKVRDIHNEDNLQMGMFSGVNSEILDEIKDMDVNTLTPIEALQKLYDIKKRLV